MNNVLFQAILSIIFCAFVMMNRVGETVSDETHTVIRYVLKMGAIICEIIIFIMLGLTSVQGARIYQTAKYG